MRHPPTLICLHAQHMMPMLRDRDNVRQSLTVEPALQPLGLCAEHAVGLAVNGEGVEADL